MRTFPVDMDHLDAEPTAQLIGIQPRKLWKTLVVEAARGRLRMAVIPGAFTLDLKALARLSGNREQLISGKNYPGSLVMFAAVSLRWVAKRRYPSIGKTALYASRGFV